jgi:hypothetical protein
MRFAFSLLLGRPGMYLDHVRPLVSLLRLDLNPYSTVRRHRSREFPQQQVLQYPDETVVLIVWQCS